MEHKWLSYNCLKSYDFQEICLSATQVFTLYLPDSVSLSLLKFKSMVTTFFAEMEGGE